MVREDPTQDKWAQPRRLLQVIAWGVGVIALIAILSAAKLASGLVAPTVLACLLALTLTPLVAGFERWRIPASPSVAG